MKIDDFGNQPPNNLGLVSSAPSARSTMKPLKVHSNLKQWRMLQAVVDHNGFLGASNHLHISQSTISYSISKLESQLGIPLLKISGRKACITETGKILLERSRLIIRELIELESLAENLKAGGSLEIRLAMDHNSPIDLIVKRLRGFTQQTPNVVISMQEAAMPDIEYSFQHGMVDIAVVSHIPVGMIGELLYQVEYVAVAAPEHPLCRLNRPVTRDELSQHIQVNVKQSGAPLHARNTLVNTPAQRVWNVCSVDTAMSAITEGVGYGWLPKYRLESAIKRNLLRIIPLEVDESYATALYLVRRKSSCLEGEIAALAASLLNSNNTLDVSVH